MSINQANAAKLVTAHGDLWAVQREAFEQATHVDQWDQPIPQARELAATAGSSGGKVALVIPVTGLLTHRRGWATGTAYTELATMIDAAIANPRVDPIIFEIDSPGGSVAGLNEAADKVAYLSKRRQTIAAVNTLAASAAYWLASQAREIVLTPSGEVGSIGVWVAHVDQSRALDQEGVTVSIISSGRYKVEGNPFEPLGDEARREMQRRVDAIHEQFIAAVSRGRRRSEQFVRAQFGEGRTVTAEMAMATGMVDKVLAFDGVINRVLTASTPARRAASLRAKLALADAWNPSLDL